MVKVAVAGFIYYPLNPIEGVTKVDGATIILVQEFSIYSFFVYSPIL